MDWQKIWDWYRDTIEIALGIMATILAVTITFGLIVVCIALVIQIIIK